MSQTGPRCSHPHTPVEGRKEQRAEGSALGGTPGVGVSALQEEVGTFPWRLRGCRAPTSRQGLGIQHQGEPFTVY